MPSVILPVQTISGQNSLLMVNALRSGHTLKLKLRTQVGIQVKDTGSHTHTHTHTGRLVFHVEPAKNSAEGFSL